MGEGLRGAGGRSRAPTVIVVMGVSGSGKSTIGRSLAARLGWEYVEGDDFHPPRNIAKMRSGAPLGASDRRPWMDRLDAWIRSRLAEGRPGVLACSALKRDDRDRLAGDRADVAIVYLDGDRDLIARRMHARVGHFFDADLLDSQFRELEPPASDEDVLSVSVAGSPQVITDDIVAALTTSASDPPDPPHPSDPKGPATG
ncbi:gluconokinase [Actinomadura logoneensis]|uniref:Gluconokinase n=1 Tax=Actinomadura logoneensis TaxID=2293572 RepID=A0A372J8T5_9ACTN|nr:gluconokinase [Actinomadura logoneensis]RFU36387.1 gluconokinase [Actinomadura logoneensis]